MMTLRIALLLGLLGCAVPPNAGAADPAKPVKVFILAGQSNMEGRAADHAKNDPELATLLEGAPYPQVRLARPALLYLCRCSRFCCWWDHPCILPH